jgi:hypothetical protein
MDVAGCSVQQGDEDLLQAHWVVTTYLEWDPRLAADGAPETGFITGEQLQRATGIAPGADCGSGAGGGSGAEVNSAAPVPRSASWRLEGSRTMAMITPAPSIAAETAKAVV